MDPKDLVYYLKRMQTRQRLLSRQLQIGEDLIMEAVAEKFTPEEALESVRKEK